MDRVEGAGCAGPSSRTLADCSATARHITRWPLTCTSDKRRMSGITLYAVICLLHQDLRDAGHHPLSVYQARICFRSSSERGPGTRGRRHLGLHGKHF